MISEKSEFQEPAMILLSNFGHERLPTYCITAMKQDRIILFNRCFFNTICHQPITNKKVKKREERREAQLKDNTKDSI